MCHQGLSDLVSDRAVPQLGNQRQLGVDVRFEPDGKSFDSCRVWRSPPVMGVVMTTPRCVRPARLRGEVFVTSRSAPMSADGTTPEAAIVGELRQCELKLLWQTLG